MEAAQKIWMDGALVDWADARVHVVGNTLHYGFGVFEGIRCYATEAGPAVFRLDTHLDRLLNSAKILGFEIPYAKSSLVNGVLATIEANGFEACYIRPIAYLGYDGMDLDYAACQVNVAIAVWHWGAFLGEGKLETGSRVRTSSYTRHHLNAAMTKAKACGNYMLFQMTHTEALRDGYDEALLLDPNGHVAEGSVEHFFLIRDGTLVTPPLTYLLDGVTRDSIITLATEHGLAVREAFFPRDYVHTADEAFFCGTGAEVTPVVELDRRPIGSGRPGPVTRKIQELFFEAVRGRNPDHLDWLTEIAGAPSAGAASAPAQAKGV
jgi:branched-chain amino acid aminotransferase